MDRNQSRHSRLAVLEGIGLWGLIVSAAVITGLGFYLARLRCDPHWVNRAGAAIVALQALAACVEYTRRGRLASVARLISSNGQQPTISRVKGQPAALAEFLNDEIARSERNAFVTVVALAAAGELLHGFGDLLFAVLTR